MAITDQINNIIEELDGSIETLPDNLITTKLKYIINLLGGSSDSRLVTEQLDVIIELLQNDDPYTPVEYIESEGTQYIDTGYYPSNTTKVEIKISDIASNAYIFGSRESWGVKDYALNFEGEYGVIYDNGCAYQPSEETTNTIVTEVPSITVNGVKNTGEYSNVYECEYPLFVFATNNAGNKYKNASMKLHYMKIWDDSVLVFDLIPVLDENNVACLYNKVTETYLYNAGSGAFIAGDPI